MYSEAGIDDVSRVDRSLRAIRRRYKKLDGESSRTKRGGSALLLKEIVDKVNLLLDQDEQVEKDAQEVDRAFLLAGHDTSYTKLPAGSRGVP